MMRDESNWDQRQDTTWRWFITPTAVREWLSATRRGASAEADALVELGTLSLTARVSESATDREHPGTVVYRGRIMVRGRSVRAECYVRVFQRAEGALPQLVRVRKK